MNTTVRSEMHTSLPNWYKAARESVHDMLTQALPSLDGTKMLVPYDTWQTFVEVMKSPLASQAEPSSMSSSEIAEKIQDISGHLASGAANVCIGGDLESLRNNTGEALTEVQKCRSMMDTILDDVQELADRLEGLETTIDHADDDARDIELPDVESEASIITEELEDLARELRDED